MFESHLINGHNQWGGLSTMCFTPGCITREVPGVLYILG